jgi:hypothetical protein
MLAFVILVPLVPLNESPSIKEGLTNPGADTLNVSAEPGMTVCPGASDWITSEGGGATTIVTVVLAALPKLSDALIESGCVPISLVVGVQRNPPLLLMLVFDADDVAKASFNTYIVGEKPVGTILNVTLVRAGIASVEESD